MTSYLIECSFALPGCKHKTHAFIERDSELMDLPSTVGAIAFGQVENVVRIIKLDCGLTKSGGQWRDATAEIAEEVAELCMTEYGRIPERLRDWIDVHVGLRAEAAE